MNWNELFTYDPITGNLTWLKGHNKGQIAGTQKRYIDGTKHAILVNPKGRQKPAHRIIWEMHYGPIPNGKVIDHVDGDPFNNVLANIRLCTQGENNRNHCVRSDNTTGVKGVHRRGKNGVLLFRLVASPYG